MKNWKKSGMMAWLGFDMATHTEVGGAGVQAVANWDKQNPTRKEGKPVG